MSSFTRALDFVLLEETGGDPNGGFTDDPVDRGGRTRWGISQRAHPDVDVATLTRAGAAAVYRRAYWDRLRIDAIYAFPVQLALFDAAVQHGASNAVVSLQREVRAWPYDGDLGPITARATNAAADARGSLVLARALIERRIATYAALIRRDPSQLRFLRGWWARTVRLTAALDG